MINEYDELLIQKCVDGELDVAAQQELLASLDEMADGWKFLALAYVEEQAWCGSFGEANAQREMQVELQFASFKPMSQAPNMEQIDMNEVQCFMPPQPAEQQSSRRSAMVTQVTCLAIALVGGVLIGDAWRMRQGGSAGANAVAKDEQGSNAVSATNRLEPQDLVAAPGQSGRSMAERLAGFPGTTTQLPPRFGAELRKNGFEFVDEPVWFKIRLDDGNYAIVPVDRKRIVPVGQ